MSLTHKILIALMWVLAGLMVADAARAERIKDLASISGVRNNQLIGYGLVVGLDGSGDQTTQTPFTVQSIVNMLSNMGVTLPPGTSLQLKNVAAVMVTATLPPFSRSGQQIDVTVSSMGNAKSLKGGTLVLTPLKGADGQVYAMAQGNVVVSGAGAAGGGSKVTVNHLSVGRVAGGATVEREVLTPLGEGEFVYFDLNAADFGTAQRMVEAINRQSPGTATAMDARQIRVRAPVGSDARVSFLGVLESIELQPARLAAKVIINARSGSVVMNQAVMLENCAVAHGNLTVSVNASNAVSQPNPLAGGQTAGVTNAQIEIRQDAGSLLHVQSGASLADVIRALNAIGANPQDLVAVLQAMKSAGALRAELEII
ncbi:flagellar basal body P-ring protein FlgI [Denitratisoma oestradiolicum]|uniref:Flagellar P-ring protein n=1 Tax=Denitratisoma oestradiolicum TaxID=311182 RepID=A0A6S6Y1Z0_9PROT|nr:flagellar biosynthesis protein FlgI [Denitratisoma oestradiolicum]CAB1370535.1 flagellar basal body P-ring protein [Denitratisoma oestradiolicum]